MIPILANLAPVLGGFLVNLQIAFGALILSLALGFPLALLRQRVPRMRYVIQPCVRLMQAAPTYVIMFFALALVPGRLQVFGTPISGLIAVILAQSVYLTTYVADNCYSALEHRRRGEAEQALLILPNLMRGFFVVVMSSGFGAAIGVSEAVATTMRQAERLHQLGDRVLLCLTVIAFFVVVFTAANALVQWLVRFLSKRHPVQPENGA
jgi:ABC-type amino acid transport system permease subunit